MYEGTILGIDNLYMTLHDNIYMTIPRIQHVVQKSVMSQMDEIQRCTGYMWQGGEGMSSVGSGRGCPVPNTDDSSGLSNEPTTD